ncbi:hypothetical protein KKE06_05840 [Candidatus Micrarchaeota archaeon]|nr:hypothetical protein [Candidatus Micrarchaeota archaeon]MBU1930502.1 hypothetical protein [Candidatus Micrarchaeota archaeon]
MAQKWSSISFRDLPPKVQEKINVILAHRAQIALPTVLLGLSISTLSAFAAQRWNLKTGLMVAGVATVGGIATLKKHQVEYIKEEWMLYRALRETPTARVKELLSGFPFVVVNLKGDLVGKKWSPKIGFLPFGRRRIPTSTESLVKSKQWREEHAKAQRKREQKKRQSHRGLRK